MLLSQFAAAQVPFAPSAEAHASLFRTFSDGSRVRHTFVWLHQTKSSALASFVSLRSTTPHVLRGPVGFSSHALACLRPTRRNSVRLRRFPGSPLVGEQKFRSVSNLNGTWKNGEFILFPSCSEDSA